MEFFKLLGVTLAVPFVLALLWFVLLVEKVGQIYGQNAMLCVIIGSIVLGLVGFFKDFWTGMIMLSVVILSLAIASQNLL